MVIDSRWYVDTNELTIRPVRVTLEEDGQVFFSWPTCHGWADGAIVSARDVFRDERDAIVYVQKLMERI